MHNFYLWNHSFNSVHTITLMGLIHSSSYTLLLWCNLYKILRTIKHSDCIHLWSGKGKWFHVFTYCIRSQAPLSNCSWWYNRLCIFVLSSFFSKRQFRAWHSSLTLDAKRRFRAWQPKFESHFWYKKTQVPSLASKIWVLHSIRKDQVPSFASMKWPTPKRVGATRKGPTRKGSNLETTLERFYWSQRGRIILTASNNKIFDS